MTRKRFQKGYVYQRGATWYGRWREDVIEADGKVVRVQKNVLLGSYRTKQLAERAMQRLLIETWASPKMAQGQLRHADARLPLNVYAHRVEDAHREAVEKAADKLFRSCFTVNGNIN